MKFFNFFQMIAFSLLITGCSGEDAQHKEHLTEYIGEVYAKMPITLKSITIEATENIGDDIEVILKSRVKTEWEFNQDIYHYSLERILGEVLAITSEKNASRLNGKRVVVYYVTQSRLKGSEWKHTNKIESITIRNPSQNKNDNEIIYSILNDKRLPQDNVTHNDIIDPIFIIDSDAYREKISRIEVSNAEAEELRKKFSTEGDSYFTKKGIKSIMKLGKGIYIKSCSACHQLDGEGIPDIFPAIKGSAVATGSMKKHIDIVTNGVSGTAMQAFGYQLNNEELAAVITYERNAFGNKTGDIAKLSAVLKAKEQ